MKGVARNAGPPMTLRARLLLVAFALPLAGCAALPQKPAPVKYLGAADLSGRPATRDPVSYWEGGAAQGRPAIKIRLSEQRAYFYKGGTLVGVSAVSTGREGHETRPGSFKITQLSKAHASNMYGDYVDAGGNVVQPNVSAGKDPAPKGSRFVGAQMPYFMRFDGAVGLHAGFLPGYAASHGCIRMPETMAANFFNTVEIGTPVTVER